MIGTVLGYVVVYGLCLYGVLKIIEIQDEIHTLRQKQKQGEHHDP